MKKILIVIFIFSIISFFLFSETINWNIFFEDLINKSIAGEKIKIENKSQEFNLYAEKTKWIPRISFDFPKLIEWQKLNTKINMLNSSYSFKLNQLLPSNGNISFISSINSNYILGLNKFKHTPSFSLQFEQPITNTAFNFINEANKIKTYKEEIKNQKAKEKFNFIKNFLIEFINLQIISIEAEHTDAEYLYAVENDNIAKEKYKNGSIKKSKLLETRQNEILKKQDFNLKENELELTKYNFFSNYNYEFYSLNKENKDSLLLFLEEKIKDFKDIDINSLNHQNFLLKLEKENVKLKNAPKFIITGSLYPDDTKNKFTQSYKSSWDVLNLKNDIWIPAISVGFYWQPDYLLLNKKQIDILNLKINKLDKEIEILKSKNRKNRLLKEKRIKSLKKDLTVLNETLEEQNLILKDFEELYKKNEITKLKLLEANSYYKSQKLLYIKKYREIIISLLKL